MNPLLILTHFLKSKQLKNAAAILAIAGAVFFILAIIQISQQIKLNNQNIKNNKQQLTENGS